MGVLRTAKGKDGQVLVNVAAIHELGSRPIVLKLVPKVRRFLHGASRQAWSTDRPGSGIAVVVPARLFLRPVLERWARPEQVSRHFRDRVASNLGGDFGQ